VVLLILAVVWTVYLFTWLRARRDRRGVNSISSFSRHLSVLERTSPTRIGGSSLAGRSPGRPTPIYPAVGYVAPRPAMSLDAARRRRRNVLYVLAGAAVTSMVLIPFMGSLMVVLHLLIDVLLAGYVVLLVRTQRLAAERRDKVRYLPQPSAMAPVAERQYALQRSAN
jgi:hypothetical protein